MFIAVDNVSQRERAYKIIANHVPNNSWEIFNGLSEETIFNKWIIFRTFNKAILEKPYLRCGLFLP